MLTSSVLAEKLNFTVFNAGEDKIISSGYCGDLLSWVMGRADSGSAWMTVMNNVNVAAVAVLRDVSCIILVEDVQPDENLLMRAKAEDIALFGSKANSFSLAIDISRLLNESE